MTHLGFKTKLRHNSNMIPHHFFSINSKAMLKDSWIQISHIHTFLPDRIQHKSQDIVPIVHNTFRALCTYQHYVEPSPCGGGSLPQVHPKHCRQSRSGPTLLNGFDLRQRVQPLSARSSFVRGSNTQHITHVHTTIAVMKLAKKCYSTAQHKNALLDCDFVKDSATMIFNSIL